MGSEVAEKAVPLADEDQKAAPGAGIPVVFLEVGREIRDPVGEKGDLDFGRAGVRGVLPVLLDGEIHFLLAKCHVFSPFFL